MTTPARALRPGPDAITPGRAPGGVVVHVYGLDDGRLLSARALVDPRLAFEHAAIDAEVARQGTDGAVILVVYDGDSGARWTSVEYWRHFAGRWWDG